MRCNAIAVGAVASEGALRAWSRFGEDAASMGRRAALRRAGQPEDIAWGIAYFVSGMSGWIAGQGASNWGSRHSRQRPHGRSWRCAELLGDRW